MTKYLAQVGNTGIYLSKTEQMDKMLKNGCDIYKIDENGVKTLIATPGQGYLIQKPTIEQVAKQISHG